MKEFFAKYLPVPGEIKESDRAFWNVQTNRVFAPSLDEKNIGNWKSLLRKVRTAQHRPVKLFLCTRNIQVGDEVMDINSNQTFIVGNIKGDEVYDKKDNWVRLKKNCIKVIGEISPEALSYVKDEDEFDKDEINIVGENSWGERHSLGLYKKGDNPKVYCEIKGPCGHYH